MEIKTGIKLTINKKNIAIFLIPTISIDFDRWIEEDFLLVGVHFLFVYVFLFISVRGGNNE